MSQRLEFQRFRRGDSCTEGCRAKHFYIQDGKKFCREGHEQAGFTQTQQDEDGWNAQGKKSRRKTVEKEKVETIYRGSEARELYLLCFQLILRKQVHWLLTVKGFPLEFETVVKDLWDLRSRELAKKNRGGTSGYASGTETESNWFATSGSEGETTDTDGKSMGGSSMRSRRSLLADGEKLPKLRETLGICYLGMLLMRFPVSFGDLYKWATRDEIVYTRAIKDVPVEMRKHLPPHFHLALGWSRPLRGEQLYETTLQLITFYHEKYDMVYPPLNSPLLIFKHIRELALPVAIYPAVQRLAALLDLDFSYLAPHKNEKSVMAHPELRLMSLIVIATKLSQPFDDVVRVPESFSDPTVIKINWKKWKQIMAKDHIGLRRGEEINVTVDDIWRMNDKDLGQYTDWYQRNMLDDREPKIAKPLLALFPLEFVPTPPVMGEHERAMKRLEMVMAGVTVQTPVLRDQLPAGGKRPGEDYKRYRKIADLPENAEAFYRLAASNAGTSLEVLVQSVFYLEIRLEVWKLKEERQNDVEN